MKYLQILILSILFTTARAQGQNPINNKQKGYFNITELGISFGKVPKSLEEPPIGAPGSFRGKSIMTTAQTINGLFLNQHLSLGVGLAVENHTTVWDENYSSLIYFLDTRLYLTKNKPNSFFIFFDIGATTTLSENGMPSNYISTGAGYKFFVAKSLALNLSAAYENIYSNTSGSGSHALSAVGMKAGVMF